jgi:hypothetical protein
MGLNAGRIGSVILRSGSVKKSRNLEVLFAELAI